MFLIRFPNNEAFILSWIICPHFSFRKLLIHFTKFLIALMYLRVMVRHDKIKLFDNLIQVKKFVHKPRIKGCLAFGWWRREWLQSIHQIALHESTGFLDKPPWLLDKCKKFSSDPILVLLACLKSFTNFLMISHFLDLKICKNFTKKIWSQEDTTEKNWEWKGTTCYHVTMTEQHTY